MTPAVHPGDAAVKTVTKGDVIEIIPEQGPRRRMLVVHVEWHIITLADLDGSPPAPAVSDG